MPIIYKETNVFEEALNRMRMIFDYNDDVIVSMSGGKDSTVLFNIALMVAREKGRLPLKVYWIDQEAEWQSTVDYMDKIMHMPEVKPYWFQIPFEFPNNLSTARGRESLLIWDPKEQERWIHPQSDISIKECPFKFDIAKNRDKAFYVMSKHLPECCADDGAKHVAQVLGLRTSESLVRRTSIMYGKARFRGETWASDLISKRVKKFWPIYDFTTDDVWTAIAKNNWEYNKCYDLMYRYGVSKNNMRVSALIHETAWHAIELLQEFEPKTYNRFIARVAGTSTFNHAFDSGGVMPRELPFMFKDWKEYRDYLLFHIVEPKYWDHYMHEWQGQEGEELYKLHVHEVILNDTCGTLNKNAVAKLNMVQKRDGGVYTDRIHRQYEEFYKEEQNGD